MLQYINGISISYIVEICLFIIFPRKDNHMDKLKNKRDNYFVEGLQGAGKTTFLWHLSDILSNYRFFYEGDFSPVDLAWCAYVTKQQYHSLLINYPSLNKKIKENTVMEGKYRIICYTKILTDIPDFHRNMEKFEIYNGNRDREAFENIVFERFQKWNGQGQVFECAIFQNIIENQMLNFMMTDDEIIDFYKKLKKILDDKPYKIIYLDIENIADGIDIIRKERTDNMGSELWFNLMVKYMEESCYGKEYALKGLDGLLTHLEKRKALEHQIIDKVFPKNTIILKAKDYTHEDIVELFQKGL